MADMDLDPESIDFYKWAKARDPVLAKWAKKLGPIRCEADAHQFKRFPYDALVRAIVYQQLTGKAAATILARFCVLFGADSIPSPEQVLKSSDEELRSVGLSRAKTVAIKDLARRVTQPGGLPGFSEIEKMTDEQIIECLSEVKGVGVWTVQMLLIFRLGRTDVFPATDYGVQKGIAFAYGKQKLMPLKKIEKMAENWKPYRSLAALVFWRVADQAPRLVKAKAKPKAKPQKKRKK